MEVVVGESPNVHFSGDGTRQGRTMLGMNACARVDVALGRGRRRRRRNRSKKVVVHGRMKRRVGGVCAEGQEEGP